MGSLIAVAAICPYRLLLSLDCLNGIHDVKYSKDSLTVERLPAVTNYTTHIKAVINMCNYGVTLLIMSVTCMYVSADYRYP